MGFLDLGPGKTKEGLQTNADQQQNQPQAVKDQQDSMKQWFNDTSLGQTLEPIQTFGTDLKQQGDALKQQGQDWFKQTAPGQVAFDFKTNLEKPLNDAMANSRTQYQADLDTMYKNAMAKLGIF